MRDEAVGYVALAHPSESWMAVIVADGYRDAMTIVHGFLAAWRRAEVALVE